MRARSRPRKASTEVDLGAVQRALLGWFRRGHRDMPWRKTRDPYAIWVSEIMLQQTRVETVRAYYTRWMARLPTVRALAEAPLDEVLSLWSGLGYYARARNLKAAAEVLLAEEGGEFPRDPGRIAALPGIGPYTTGAIASIAFDLPEPILDGNVARILSRIFLIDAPAEAARTRAELWSRARALVPTRGAGDFNQAMMELGATVCTPRDPACLTCPVASQCRARAAGRALELPRRKLKRVTPTVEQLALLVKAADRVLLARRPARGLWGGLWEPPCLSIEAKADPLGAAATRFGVKLSRLAPHRGRSRTSSPTGAISSTPSRARARGARSGTARSRRRVRGAPLGRRGRAIRPRPLRVGKSPAR